MRLVFWNANMGLHYKLPVLDELRPDVAVLPECADEATLRQKAPLLMPPSMVWVGSNPNKGLGVLAFGGYRLELDGSYEASIPWIAPVRVGGPVSFHLLAVWACHNGHPAEPDGKTCGPLIRALDRYRDFLTSAPAVVGGDLNNHVCWDKPGKANNHANAVERMAQLGLFSAYHAARGVEQGQEPEPTLYWKKRTQDGPKYHIDYCFLPYLWRASLLGVKVGTFEEWTERKRSDHVPLIVDLELLPENARQRAPSV